MFDLRIKIVQQFKRVIEAEHKAALDNISHAAAGIRKDALESIKESGRRLLSYYKAIGFRAKEARKQAAANTEASEPGQPPHSRGRLKKANAIIYAVRDNDMSSGGLSALIGVNAAVMGQSGSAHELGGTYKKQTYPKRPFMVPAMKKRVAAFGGSFSGCLGGSSAATTIG